MTAFVAAAVARINWWDVALILAGEFAIVLRFTMRAALCVTWLAACTIMIVMSLLFAQRLPYFIRKHF